MSKSVLLNGDVHKDLRIITDRSEKYGDNIWYALSFPLEFRSLQAYYPIFFQRDAKTKRYFALALLGFQEGENLFLEDECWKASYIPLSIQRQPFLIGHKKITVDGVDNYQRVIHIDINSPRVSTDRGERLFMEFGGASPFLDKISDMLETIHQGIVDGDRFIDMLVEIDLIEEFVMEIKLSSGDIHVLKGFYTINEDKLLEMDSETLFSLHKSRYLEPIYMILASHSNVRKMIETKNSRMF